MAKKNEIDVKIKSPGQKDLSELHGKDERKFIEAAKRLTEADKRRIRAKEQVDVERQNLRELAKKADLKPIDGKIKFKCGGYVIEITPKEDGVKVKGEEKKE